MVPANKRTGKNKRKPVMIKVIDFVLDIMNPPFFNSAKYIQAMMEVSLLITP